MNKKLIVIAIFVIVFISGCSCSNEPTPMEKNIKLPVNKLGRYEEEYNLPTNYSYVLESAHEVDGRQGIAYENNKYYVSGSTTLSIYDKSWNLIKINDKPFEEFKDEVNHIGDIDVYNNEIYAGVEYFLSGVSKNIQMSVYDIDTLKLKRTYNFDKGSGQEEVSGIAIDPDSKSIWMCSWGDGESGRYLYRYNLEDGKYLGKYHLQAPPQWIQGIAYLDGYIYITSDDGNADLGEADHIYRVKVDIDKTNMPVLIERTLDDVTLFGEIEGLSFDKDNNKLLLSYNRGSKIELGMPVGFYKGYDKEIHEVFIYDMKKNS